MTRIFQVEHLRFRGYSLRRGGATAFFGRTGIMEKTLLRGRWASVSVARVCVMRWHSFLALLPLPTPRSWSPSTVLSGRPSEDSHKQLRWGSWKADPAKWISAELKLAMPYGLL